jgi:hypothetical protein
MVYSDQLRYGEFAIFLMLQLQYAVVNNIFLEYYRLMPSKFADQNMKL